MKHEHKFNIRLASGSVYPVVVAESSLDGRWILHRSIGRPGWTVSHKGTTLAAIEGIRKRAGRRLLAALDTAGPFRADMLKLAAMSTNERFRPVSNWSRELRERLRDIVYGAGAGGTVAR